MCRRGEIYNVDLEIMKIRINSVVSVQLWS